MISKKGTESTERTHIGNGLTATKQLPTYTVDITITSRKLKSIIPIYNPRYDGGLHQL